MTVGHALAARDQCSSTLLDIEAGFMARADWGTFQRYNWDRSESVPVNIQGVVKEGQKYRLAGLSPFTIISATPW
jgi:hypothetical protein